MPPASKTPAAVPPAAVNPARRRALRGPGHLRSGALRILRILRRVRPAAAELLEGALDVVAPGFCRHCEASVARGRDPFCPACLAAIRWSVAPCPRCGQSDVPVAVGSRRSADDLPPRCPRCRRRRPAFDLAAAGGIYTGVLRTAVLRFKFHRDRAVLPLLEEAVARAAKVPAIAECLRETAILVPVPAHPLRSWWRGWDPVDELARAVSGKLPTGAVTRGRILRKVRWTRPQVELRGDDRRENLRAAFRVRRGVRVPERVAILDDVLTTGTTAGECALALKRAGARRVVVIAVARS